MNALVSIVIATYRRSDELARAISSAIDQTYPNCEIIVVDDNDEKDWNKTVKAIVEEFSTTSTKEIRLIQNHPNQGSAKTRNVGITASAGDYVVFLDDDDLFLPDRVKSQIEEMLKTDADFGITDLVLYNEDESINEVRKRDYLNTAEGENLLLCHLKYHLTGTDTLMFKKEYLLKIGGFDPIDSGDEYYLMMKAIRNGGTLCHLPRCDVKAYVHTGEGGLSSGAGKIKGENKLYEFKKTFFSALESKDRSYVKMRHYAVLAFAYLRMKKPVGFLWNGVLGFLSSPTGCIKLLKSRRA